MNLEGESYEVWEYVVIGVAAAIMLLYHLAVRSSSIGSHQHDLLDVWAQIHEHTYKNAITGVQLMRNMMYVSALLGGISISVATLLALRRKVDHLNIELTVVVGLYLLAFLNYMISANVTHHLTYFIVMFPRDVQKPADDNLIKANSARILKLLAALQLHFSLGRRSLFVAVPATAIIFGPVALLLSTIFAVFIWHYADRTFGVAIDGTEIDSSSLF